MSKNLKAILSGAVALILSAACIFCPAIIAGSPSAASASTGSSNAADNSTLASEYDISVSKRDASGEYDAQEAVTLLPDDDLTITVAGVYMLSGNYENTMIVVDVSKEDKVQLVLANANLSNANGPAIYVRSADKVFITAAEGTVKTLSPRVNILNYFIDKVDMPSLDLDFSNLSDEQLAELNGPIAMELIKFFDSTSRSAAKTAETLDMLEKGQIGVRTEFGFEQKALGSVERMVNFVVRALMVVALFIGSCLLCTVPVGAMETTPFLVAFPIVGSVGYVVSIFFAWRLYKGMKKD